MTPRAFLRRPAVWWLGVALMAGNGWAAPTEKAGRPVESPLPPVLPQVVPPGADMRPTAASAAAAAAASAARAPRRPAPPKK